MEEIAKQITINVSYAVKILAAVIIGIAIIKTVYNYFLLLKTTGLQIYKENIRVEFGSSVAVSLELLFGADVLATAVAPSGMILANCGYRSFAYRTKLFFGKGIGSFRTHKTKSVVRQVYSKYYFFLAI